LAAITHEAISISGLKESKIKAVCLGIPGSVNPYTGRIGLAPNLGLKNFYIKEKLQKKIHVHVLIENDVNLGALGIKNFGVGKKNKNILVMFVGTGIGGALIFDGKIYRGTHFMAGEIGHMIVQENGPLCACGKKGCFEAVASRTAIVPSTSAKNPALSMTAFASKPPNKMNQSEISNNGTVTFSEVPIFALLFGIFGQL